MEHCPTLSQGVANLLVLPSMSDSSQVSQFSHSQLSDILETLASLQHRVTAWNNAPWGHCPLSQREKLYRLDRYL